MTIEPPRLGWRTPEPVRLARNLRHLARAETDPPAAGVAARLTLMSGDRDELELELEREAHSVDAPVRPAIELTVSILAIGWATVDLDRWGRAEHLLDDALLGARTAVAVDGLPLSGVTVPVLLLEPSTEGRIAARLARHGEGVAAVYLAESGERRDVDRATSSGPFGPSSLAVDPRYGPFLVTCRGPYPRLSPPRTIEP